MHACILVLAGLLLLAGCGGPASTTSTPGAAGNATAVATAPASNGSQADLNGVKEYLLGKVATLKKETEALKAASDSYYALAQGKQFNYASLWSGEQARVTTLLQEGRARWMAASPGYEQIEGVVAGVPSLAEYDVILDAGTSGAESPEDAVPFDLTLPDGRVLPKPGNLFGVTESTLWGTFPEFTAQGVTADLNGDGKRDFGEALPDANVLKAAADALDRYTDEMAASAQAWQPTASDAFTALVVMVPTMTEYFESWKGSRFVAGEASTQRDFVVISRLSDIVDILSGLQVVYTKVSPMVGAVDPTQDKQISERLEGLKTFVAGVYAQEQGGKKFTAEEADLLGVEAQNQATAIVGLLTQVAAQVKVEIQQ